MLFCCCELLIQSPILPFTKKDAPNPQEQSCIWQRMDIFLFLFLSISHGHVPNAGINSRYVCVVQHFMAHGDLKRPCFQKTWSNNLPKCRQTAKKIVALPSTAISYATRQKNLLYGKILAVRFFFAVQDSPGMDVRRTSDGRPTNV